MPNAYDARELAPQLAPWCPGCWFDAPEGTYPPSLSETTWWCFECMTKKVKA